MDRQYIDSNQVIERYLLNRLSPAETDEFEQAFLGDPDLRLELEAARHLLLGLRESARLLQLGPGDPLPPARPQKSSMTAGAAPPADATGTHGPVQFWPRLAAAASVAAIAVAIALGVQVSELREQVAAMSTARPSADGLLVRLPRTRDADGIATRIYADSQTQNLTLLPDLPSQRHGMLHYELLSASGELIWHGDAAPASAPHVVVPASLVGNGQEATLEVKDIGDRDRDAVDLGRYRFVVHLP